MTIEKNFLRDLRSQPALILLRRLAGGLPFFILAAFLAGGCFGVALAGGTDEAAPWKFAVCGFVLALVVVCLFVGCRQIIRELARRVVHRDPPKPE
ncbi:MAG: hypothetical protein JXR37_06815 [Kiritimatiellae bacterium]|nr:hypothetical protein [Kiritimatiellia bacterium]